MGEADLIRIREQAGRETCILFIHGFGGNAETTWGRFPEFLAETPAIDGWNIYSLGYQTSLAPEIRGLWTADPDIPTLATYLRTRAEQPPLDRHRRFALIAHSMGGLVVQKALVDFDNFAHRVSHVLLYGTPSKGLKKASGLLSRLFKRQTGNMDSDGPFISDLRLRWTEKFGAKRDFAFKAVAGDQDDFVPAWSSLKAFDSQDNVVVPGNHLEIVKPESPDSMSVKAALKTIVGDAAPGGPWNAASVALERGEFQEAIDRLEPNASKLDQRHLVKLALALDATGRRERSIEVLVDALEKKGAGRPKTDAMGVLAGRRKREWMAGGLEEAAREALDLYGEAYGISREDPPDHEQAFYHGINVAFMQYAFAEDFEKAKSTAAEVLAHCDQAAKHDHWREATRGEACLYLGKPSEALRAYERAIGMTPSPRELESMYTQAGRIVELQGDDETQKGLERVFRRGLSS